MKWFRGLGSESILVRLGICIGMIVALALLSIAVSAIFGERSSGKAQAINLAGSLRMQAYIVNVRMLEARAGGPLAKQAFAAALTDFDRRIGAPALHADLGMNVGQPARDTLRNIETTWRRDVVPALLAAADGRLAVDIADRQVDMLVASVDALVNGLEQDTETRFRMLRLIEGITLFVILMVIATTIFLMHIQVYLPITDLLRCARAVRDGDFTACAEHTGDDELGQLGQTFNTMVERLSETYEGLEARVAEKTAELGRSNRSLELLYSIARKLSAAEVDGATLGEVLAEVERVIDLPAGAICGCDPDRRQGVPLAELGRGDAGIAVCRRDACVECIGEGGAHMRSACSDTGLRIVSIPLTDGGQHYGMMPLALPAGRELEPWQWQLLEAVGSHVGAALATARRHEERHRLALFEERSVIARELHDSLAQSLSYLKIQVARLQKTFGEEVRVAGATEVLAELKSGLANAYRQLRELLSTFRLRMDGRGLAAALESTTTEFARRTDCAIRLDNRLHGIELTSGEEIHVLQIVREALSNVEHHARASKVLVGMELLTGGRVRVRIDDDGVGLRSGEAPMHHYGLAIMRDRAAGLGGTISVFAREGGGTRVELEFTAKRLAAGEAAGGAA